VTDELIPFYKCQFTPAEVLATNRWPLAYPHRRLEIRIAAEPAAAA
jgi:hypothetical protein